jgi:integrase
MGLKLPPYVHGFVDRHGKARYYFRRPGFKRATLPGLPYSDEFMSAYEAAARTSRADLGASRSRPGTVAAAIAGYFASTAFTKLAETTRRSRRQILERFRVEHGDKSIATLGRVHVERMIEARAAQPGTALNFLVALRALMRHSVLVGLCGEDPTAGIRGPKFRSDGFYTWTEEDIAAFEATHPVGSRARLALALGLYTGQRRSDVVRMGRQHVRDDVVHVRQSKTGKTLAIPVHPELRAALQATPADNMTFLTSRHGKPFDPDAFTHWFKDKCQEAGLPARASFHGLRKAACRRLADLGLSALVIASISGHSSLREVSRYTAAADQLRLARLGIEALTRTKAGNPERRIGNRRSKTLKQGT